MSPGAGRTGAGLVVALVLALVGAAPAAAHNRFAASDPSDGATVARTPSAVVLTFEEPAVALGTRVVVTGPAGPVSVGVPRLVDRTVSQPLAAGAEAGRYTVDWRVTSADGHPITGTFAFTAEAAGAGQPGPAPSAARAPAPASPPAAWPWLLLAAALFVLAGFLRVRRRRQRVSELSAPEAK